MTNWIKEHGLFSGIAGAILAAIVAIIIALIPSKQEDNQGVSIGGNVIVSGDTAITGNGNISITKEVSKTSDRMESIQKRLSNIHSQDPVINDLIQKAKDYFYANQLVEVEKIIKEIEFKQGTNP